MEWYRGLHRVPEALMAFDRWYSRVGLWESRTREITVLDEGGRRLLLTRIDMEASHRQRELVTVVEEVQVAEPFPIELLGPG